MVYRRRRKMNTGMGLNQWPTIKKTYLARINSLHLLLR